MTIEKTGRNKKSYFFQLNNTYIEHTNVLFIFASVQAKTIHTYIQTRKKKPHTDTFIYMHTLLHLFKKSTVKLMLIKPFKPARAHTKYKTSIRLKIRLFFIFLEIYTHTYTYHQNYYYIFQKLFLSLQTSFYTFFCILSF